MTLNTDEPQLVRSVCSALLRPDPAPLATLLRAQGIPVMTITAIRVEVAGPTSRPDIIIDAQTDSGCAIVIVIEAKVCAPVDVDQMAEHRRAAKLVVLLVPEHVDATAALNIVDGVILWDELFDGYTSWAATAGLRADLAHQLAHGTARQARAILAAAAKAAGCSAQLSPSTVGRPTVTWTGTWTTVQVEPHRTDPTRFQAVVGIRTDVSGWPQALAAVAPHLEPLLQATGIAGSATSGHARDDEPDAIAGVPRLWRAGYPDYRGRRTVFVPSHQLPQLLAAGKALAAAAEAAVAAHIGVPS